MKRLKLTTLNLSASQILTKEQMKIVLGGSGTCAFTFNVANIYGSISYNGSSAVAQGSIITVYGTDMASASNAMSLAGEGGSWCCDSCSDAPWYNPPQ